MEKHCATCHNPLKEEDVSICPHCGADLALQKDEKRDLQKESQDIEFSPDEEYVDLPVREERPVRKTVRRRAADEPQETMIASLFDSGGEAKEGPNIGDRQSPDTAVEGDEAEQPLETAPTSEMEFPETAPEPTSEMESPETAPEPTSEMESPEQDTSSQQDSRPSEEPDDRATLVDPMACEDILLPEAPCDTTTSARVAEANPPQGIGGEVTIADPFGESVEEQEGEQESHAEVATSETGEKIHDTEARGEAARGESPAKIEPTVHNELHTTWVQGSIFNLGDVINQKYKIVEFLGQGGMGSVYKVEHLLLPHKKSFALKILHPQLSQNPTFQKRFIREVEIAMEFTHPHVVPIRDFGAAENGAQYFTMDFSSGISLRALLKKESSLSEARTLNIARQVLSALSCGHEKGIIHRDLKPENILIEKRFGKDHALILDFGIARLLSDASDEKITQQHIIGTPMYMSPEQAGGDQVDMRTDLYSMGVLLYEMVTGQTPYQGNSREILLGHLVKPLPSLREVKPDISQGMESIIKKAMQKDRNERYRTADDFISDINRTLGLTHEVVPCTAAPSPKSRKLWIIMLIALLAFVAAGIAYVQIEARNLEEQFKNTLDSRKYNDSREIVEKMQMSWFHRSRASGLQSRLQQRRKDLIAEGVAALHEEDFVKAEVRFKEAQEIAAEVAETKVLGSIEKIFVGRDALEVKDWAGAFEAFQEAAKISGAEIPYLTKAMDQIEKKRDVLIAEGREALRQGDFKRAQNVFLQAQQIKKQDRDAGVLVGIDKILEGMESLQNEEWGRAFRTFQEAEKFCAGTEISYLTEAIKQCIDQIVAQGTKDLQAGEFQKALQSFQQSPIVSRDVRAQKMALALEKILEGIAAENSQNWSDALRRLDEARQILDTVIARDVEIPALANSIANCRQRVAEELAQRAAEAVRQGQFHTALGILQNSPFQDDALRQKTEAIQKICRGMEEVKKGDWEIALESLKDARKDLEKAFPSAGRIPALEEAVNYCEQRLIEDVIARGTQTLREGRYEEALKIFNRRSEASEDSQVKKFVTAIQKIQKGMEMMEARDYGNALKKLESAQSNLQQASPGIKISSLEEAILRCKDMEKDRLGKEEEKRKKTLKDRLKRAKDEYSKGNWKKTQKLLEEFFEEGGEKLDQNSRESASRYLALSYCKDGRWKDALPWFDQTKLDSEVMAYYGLAYYHVDRSKDAEALQFIGKALEEGQHPSMVVPLRHAQVQILKRSFSEQESRLFTALKEYVPLVPDDPEVYLYWKDLGYLAKKFGNNEEAVAWFQQYLQAIAKMGKEDDAVISELISLQDFHPVGKGYYWVYNIEILGGKKVDRLLTVTVVRQTGNRYEVDSDGTMEEWSVEGGYLYKRSQEAIPKPLKFKGEWERHTSRRTEYAKVTRANVPLDTKAGKFLCVEVAITCPQEPNYRRVEYYAPGVGEIKSEVHKGTVKDYERSLVKYKVR